MLGAEGIAGEQLKRLTENAFGDLASEEGVIRSILSRLGGSRKRRNAVVVVKA